MTRRNDWDVIGAPLRAATAEHDLFNPPPEAKTRPNYAETYTPAERKRDIERLVPLAQELAQRAGEHGITVSNLRITAVQRGLLTGQEQGRRLSFLGAVMRAAGLHNTGQYRRSDVAKSHGNIHAIWCSAHYARRVG